MTRAKLDGPPYRTADGRWKAPATINGRYASVACTAEHAPLRKGDVLNVIRDGMEWRVG